MTGETDTTVDGIDTTDFSILSAVRNVGRPLWKNKIHEYIVNNVERLPLLGAVSVQTVGRRVDRLSDDGFLDNVIINPDELQRDLIIGFKLTEKGEAAINEERSQILTDIVRRHLFSEVELEKDAIVELLAEEFNLEDRKDQMLKEYSRDDVLAFLTLSYLSENVDQRIPAQAAETLSDTNRKVSFQQLV